MTKRITSVNLSVTPFISSCDSTRANMASKQFSQSLTSTNCEIPYVLSNEWAALSDSSTMGIYKAKDDGVVVLNNNDIMIVFYPNGNNGVGSYEIRDIPPVRKTTSIFSSSLRTSLREGSIFKKNDIVYEYDCFKNGMPSSGYNTFIAYTPFFGFNHEDALVISESFSEKARHKFISHVHIPIFEFTLLQKLYQNSLGYFPDIGETIRGETVCASLLPSDVKSKKDLDSKSVKAKVINMLQGMNLSDLINMRTSGQSSGFSSEQIKSKIENGKITGVKVHRLRKDVKLIDVDLQKSVEKLYNRYGHFILQTYNDLTTKFNETYAKKVMRNHYVYADRDKIRGPLYLKDVVYLIELEITKDYGASIGDKLSTRHASKGVVSLILPDELRPICAQTQQPVDFVYNPFGVFSRMNLSQVLEGIVSKPVWLADKRIKENSDNLIPELTRINETVLKYLNNNDYCDRISQLIKVMQTDSKIRNSVIESIQQNNLFVEVPSFAKIDLTNLIKHAYPKAKEQLIIKKETVDYMKSKLNAFEDFTVTSDIVIDNVFVSNIYVQKLHKIAEKIITARDLGPIAAITGQPLRGRAVAGGSKLGQMEIEAILANGCEKALRELLTVKNDWNHEKRKMVASLISTGKYTLPDESSKDASRTKKVVNTILKFLKD